MPPAAELSPGTPQCEGPIWPDKYDPSQKHQQDALFYLLTFFPHSAGTAGGPDVREPPKYPWGRLSSHCRQSALAARLRRGETKQPYGSTDVAGFMCL